MKSKEIIDCWDKIQMDSAADERVLKAILARNSLYAKKKEVPTMKKTFPKLVYVLSAILLLCGLTFGTVFAAEIKGFIATVLSLEDGTTCPISEIATVKIKDTAVISHFLTPMTHGELEEMLGVRILNTDLASTDSLGYSTLLSKGKIARVDLWQAGFIDFDNEDKSISMAVSFLTPAAGEEYIDAFKEGIDAAGGKEIKGSHEFTLLGQVTVYGNSWSETRLNAAFVYSDMLYTIITENVSEAELLEILASLK